MRIPYFFISVIVFQCLCLLYKKRLKLYYVLKSPDTPKSDKLLIVSALSYLVLPIDLISARRLPVIGWIDEIASLTIAYQKVSKYITLEIQWKVDNILDRWFPETEPEVLTN